MHRTTAVIEDYASTVGPTRAAVDAMDGSQPGDPTRAAASGLGAVAATTVDPGLLPTLAGWTQYKGK